VLYTVVFIRRYLRCITGEEVYQHRSLRFFLNAFGAIKAVRSSMQQDYIYQAINTLNRGGVIEIYPEAHFGNNKEIQPFKTSYLIMAAQTNAPIITCYQTGEHNFIKRPKVAIAKPFYTKDYFDTPNPSLEQLNNLNKIIEDKMRELKKMVGE
jgi:1-acyl-sn-glycerol-3-phosphate acyltransferase